ncbi:hypothetical protein DFH09DRAFT_1466589, partial [Mycena vulgaris]
PLVARVALRQTGRHPKDVRVLEPVRIQLEEERAELADHRYIQRREQQSEEMPLPIVAIPRVRCCEGLSGGKSASQIRRVRRRKRGRRVKEKGRITIGHTVGKNASKNFDPVKLHPALNSTGQMVFNWHEDDDLGDHNTVDTQIFELTDGGNATLSLTTYVTVPVSAQSTGPYVIETMAVQFNKTHFAQSASSTPWVAIFPYERNDSAGNTSDLISNAQKLGARAILASGDDPNLRDGILEQRVPDLLRTTAQPRWPEQIKFYNATAMTSVAANITSDFKALRASSSSLAQTDVLLMRTPAISTNMPVVSVTSTSTSTSTSTPQPTKRLGLPSGSIHSHLRFFPCCYHCPC